MEEEQISTREVTDIEIPLILHTEYDHLLVGYAELSRCWDGKADDSFPSRSDSWQPSNVIGSECADLHPHAGQLE
jgi:hypothetical protein